MQKPVAYRQRCYKQGNSILCDFSTCRLLYNNTEQKNDFFLTDHDLWTFSERADSIGLATLASQGQGLCEVITLNFNDGICLLF